MSRDPTSKAWSALHRPLSFASRDGFRNIDAVKDLGATLHAAAVALARSLDGEAGQQFADYATRLEQLERLPRGGRVQLVARGLRLCATFQPAAGRPAPRTPAKKATHATGADPQPEGVSSPLTVLKGVGPALAGRLATRGIRVLEDLLYLLPLEYQDRRVVTPLSEVRDGQQVTTRGTVVSARQRGGRGRRMLELGLAPGERDKALLQVVWFRSYPALAEAFTKGTVALVSGTVRTYKDKLQMAHPDFALDPDGDGSAGIHARYPDVEGFAPARLQKLVRQACERFVAEVVDGVPASVARAQELPLQADALRALHLLGEPPDDESLERLQSGEHEALRRLAFDELFSLQLAVAQRRQRWGGHRAPACPLGQEGHQRLRRCLPFTLTGAQDRVLGEIAGDMGRERPMHRLLQGDVGSGKTAVAFGAAWAAMSNGMQAAIMAPTEILARQHFAVLEPWCKQLGRRAALLTASTPRAAKESLLALADGGYMDLLVGTHALLARRVSLPNLGLAVVDEQHRFGVLQRARLRGQGPEGMLPHLLVMTATPIPRSMALTVYGDLDLSLLDEKPPGRTPPLTTVHTGEQREEAYEVVAEQLVAGQQVFVVCPLVEESDKLQVADAVGTSQRLQERFADVAVGLVHGRLNARERDAVMDGFRRGEVRLLVATTVIEVGIDVPEANVMVIEHAERFGLAQLHQLRGRVGRSAQSSSRCLLLTEAAPSSTAGQRLAVLARTSDGFEVAESDLGFRGPGEVMGTRQSGAPRFRFASLQRHLRLLTEARQAAQAVVEGDPDLSAPENREAREVMTSRWKDLPLVGAEAG